MRNYRKLVYFIVGFTLLTITLTLVACNNIQPQKPNNTTNPSTNNKLEKSAVELMESMAEYKNLNMQELLTSSVESLVNKSFSNPDVINWQLNSKGDLLVYLTDDSVLKSAYLDLPSSYQSYAGIANNTSSKKDIVYSKSRLVSGLKVKEDSSDESQVVSILQNAISEIKQDLSSIASKNFSRINTFVSAEMYDSKDLSEQALVYGKNEFNSSVFGALCNPRSDGSLLAYAIDQNLQLVEYYAKFAGSDMSAEEKKLAFLTGKAAFTTKIIDPSVQYSAPALDTGEVQPPVEETVTVGEIYDEYFSNLNFDEEFEMMLQKNYSTYVQRNLTTLFYTYENHKLTVYANSHALNDNYNTLVSASFNVVENSAVDYYLKGFKEGILDKAGLNTNDDIKTSDVQKTKNQIDEAASSFKNELMFASLENTERKSYTSQSPKISNQQAFAEKLFPGKEIVAAYVGDLSPYGADSENDFGSVYTSNFQMTIVYKDGNNIKIYKTNCFVPWYSNSTDESLYNSFLNGDIEKNYKLRNEETTVVSNPHMVEDKESKTTIIYNLEFEEVEEGVNAVIGTPLPCP